MIRIRVEQEGDESCHYLLEISKKDMEEIKDLYFDRLAYDLNVKGVPVEDRISLETFMTELLLKGKEMAKQQNER